MKEINGSPEHATVVSPTFIQSRPAFHNKVFIDGDGKPLMPSHLWRRP